MKVGIVSPYSFDVPGGVQWHIRDLAVELRNRGVEVEIFAPGEPADPIEGFVSAGRALAVPYNGSVARLCFGPAARMRTRSWLAHADLDVLHVHEPLIPSVSLLALSSATCPIVATFHMATVRSLAYQASMPFLARASEKISARIAVSQEARKTLIHHHGGDAVIIPNGVDTRAFAVEPEPQWQARPGSPVFVFLGRVDEPRKGLNVFAGAIPAVRAVLPQARFLVAGRGDATKLLGEAVDDVEILGEISDADKARLLAGASAYVAPQTGGESFGIVLVEAMAAGCPVIASNIPAFDAVCEGGRSGRLFAVGDSQALAHELIDLGSDNDEAGQLRMRGRERAARFDWSVVTNDVMSVYETVCRSNDVEVDTGSRLAALGIIREVADE
ncbi:MAG: glycosyltransferase family 4 protein [Actinomycetaceae bacterium]|nr:glycosyltransferase family 4 protein [Actinomycetaceae bacterium]